MKNPHTKDEQFKLLVMSIVATVVGLPFVAAGILCTLTVIGAIIGLPLILLGALPLYWVQKRRADQIRDWALRERPMDNDEEYPWMTQ